MLITASTFSIVKAYYLAETPVQTDYKTNLFPFLFYSFGYSITLLVLSFKSMVLTLNQSKSERTEYMLNIAFKTTLMNTFVVFMICFSLNYICYFEEILATANYLMPLNMLAIGFLLSIFVSLIATFSSDVFY